MKDLGDRVVVVTGAASGIGRSAALAFAREGARVHLVDVDCARVEEASSEARGASPGCTSHVVDVRDAAAVEDLAGRVMQAEGRVDVLVNNAGVCLGGPVETTSLDDWRWITDVNYWGVVHGIRSFVPLMIAQASGHIVNTASMAGLVGLPFVAAYCATKFAVVGLSEALSVELAVHGIHVTVVCPGFVRTSVVANARMKLPGDWNAKVERAFERWATDPDRIARRIVGAVRRERSFVVAGREMLPLWMLRGLSVDLYQSVMRALARRALKRR